MKIKIFYHILLVNHWYTIVKDQLGKIELSGLLDNVSEFNIGLSVPDELDSKSKCKLIQFFYDYILNYVYPGDYFYGKKFNIIECKKSEYEYPILEDAVNQSKLNKDFIGFYLHTKGVSNPSYLKDQFREGMNVGCIDHWKDHFEELKSGKYDMSGINLLDKNKHYPDDYKYFYSGNFFFFHPDFFSKIDFSKIDKSDRFHAESIYGMLYNARFNNLGYGGLNSPFLKTGNYLEKIKNKE